MSYAVNVGGMSIFVDCVANPEENYELHYNEIKKKIEFDGYQPKTSFENLIKMVMLHFDCDDNYGEYDEVTGFGGYGNSFTLDECLRFVEESGGWAEFDYEI